MSAPEKAHPLALTERGWAWRGNKIFVHHFNRRIRHVSAIGKLWIPSSEPVALGDIIAAEHPDKVSR